jgi:hypothetical protein
MIPTASAAAAISSVFVLIFLVVCCRVYAQYLKFTGGCQQFFNFFLNGFRPGKRTGKALFLRVLGINAIGWTTGMAGKGHSGACPARFALWRPK